MNDRIYFALQQLTIRKVGVAAAAEAHAVKGVQSAGLSLRLNQEQVFQLGQTELYDMVENVPDVELTVEKVLDGHPLIYHLATVDSPSATLAGRSKARCIAEYSVFSDTQENATGTPIRTKSASGLVVGSVNFNFPVDGNFTESVTLMGNSAVLPVPVTNSGFFSGSGTNSQPLAPEGVNRKQHFLFGSTAPSGMSPSRLPFGLDGVEGISGPDGYNLPITAGDTDYRSKVQSIRVACNMGRENLNQLGRKGPYAKFMSSNVEVTTDIEILSTSGDTSQATENGIFQYGRNTVPQTIFLATSEGTQIDLGNKNRLRSTSYGNANANGGNATMSYQYVTYNRFTVKHKNDPTSSLRP